MMKSIYAIYGAGGCGRGVMPLARQQLAKNGFSDSELVFVDDSCAPSTINGHRVLSYLDFLNEPAGSRYAVIAIANSMIRKKIANILTRDGVNFWSVFSDNVVVMDDVLMGEGAVISPFVTLTSNIKIGHHFHANLYSYVEHDCVIGDYVTFAPGVKCNGNIFIEDHAYIGAGAVIKQGRPDNPLVIGRGAIIGMGAVVTKSVEPGLTVVGNPAKPVIKF